MLFFDAAASAGGGAGRIGLGSQCEKMDLMHCSDGVELSFLTLGSACHSPSMEVSRLLRV